MNIRIRITLFAIALFALLAPLAAFAEEPFVRSHVVPFNIDEQGVVQPAGYFLRNRALDLKSEEELQAVLSHERLNPPVARGHVAIRARNGAGEVIYRTLLEVELLVHSHDDSGREQASRLPDPGFIAIVPAAARTIEIEGWLPAMRATFDAGQLGARLGDPRTKIRSDATAEKTKLPANRWNILILGDGYLEADGQKPVPDDPNSKSLFERDVNVVQSTLFSIPPYSRYKPFFNVLSHFDFAAGKGAKHPACTSSSKECDTQEPTASNHTTVFGSSYCGGNPVAQRALVVSHDAIRLKIAELIDGTGPDTVLVLVNDEIFGGSRSGFVITTSMRQPSHAKPFTPPYPAHTGEQRPDAGHTVAHELGHAFGLSDEYVDLIVGPPLYCNGTCGPNVDIETSSGVPPALATMKWARWVDATTVPTCTQAQSATTPPCSNVLPNPPPNPPVYPIGLYEGAGRYPAGAYRPDFNCLMRSLGTNKLERCTITGNNIVYTEHRLDTLTPVPPPFCRVCADEIIRKLYGKVDQIESIREKNSTSRAERFSPWRVGTGETVAVGADVVTPNNQGDAAEAQTVEWKIDGQPAPQHRGKPTIPYTGVRNRTSTIEMIVTDPTTSVRASSAAHTHGAKAKPIAMNSIVKWTLTTPWYMFAETSGTTESVQTAELTVPRGSTGVSLKYGVTTQEPGDSNRPGDSWSILVGYGGTTATAATASDAIYSENQVIKSAAQNFQRALNLKVDASAGDVKIVVTIRIQNLETSGFIDSRIEAEIVSDGPGGCDTLCQFCRDNPGTPGCPVPFEIATATMLPLENDANNRGPNSFVSIAQRRRLDAGRHVQIQTSPMPGNLKVLRITAKLLNLYGEELATLRSTTWDPLQGRAGGAKGLERIDTSAKWKFNVAQKKDFNDPLPSIPEEQWLDNFKYSITMTLETHDGRTATQQIDVDRFVATEPPFERPLRALWEEPANVEGIWHDWVSVQAHRWFKQYAGLVYRMDRNADAHGAYDTPVGHEYGNAFTEVPFYPNAAVWTNSSNAIYSPYLNFRRDAAALAFEAMTAVQRAERRAKLAKWINDTRAHLSTLVPNDAVNWIRLGDGSKACQHPFIRPDDPLAEGWMRELLEYGRISNAQGFLLVDLTMEPGVGTTQWQVSAPGKLIYSCEYNFWPSVVLDRCKIGEFPGPCRTGRPPGTGRTRITRQPAGASINAGDTATLLVSAEGDDLRYRWYAGPAGDFVLSSQLSSNDATVAVAPPETQQYWVYVWGANGSEISQPAIVQVAGTGGPCVRPSITQQPRLFTEIRPDESTTLSVRAQGTNLRYQWFYSVSTSDTPTPIGGATQPDYSATSAGRYTVRVSNSCGEQTSVGAYVAHLSSCQVPEITGQSPDAMVKNGDSIDLFVTATGKAPLSYTWYEAVPNGGARAVGYSRTVRVRPTINGTQYFATVGNECKYLTGEPITIAVCDVPVVTHPPQAKNIVRGDTTSLSVTTSGTTPMTVVWTNAGDSSNAGFGPSINVSPQVTTSYFATITNACGSETSLTATVTVCQPATITAQPQNANVTKGQSTTLGVTAGGNGPFSYQWYANGSSVGGAVNATFLVTPDQTTPYHVVVTGACGPAVTSNAVTVTVCHPPQITKQPVGMTVVPGQNATLSAEASGTGPLTYKLIDQDSNTIATNTTGAFEFAPPPATRQYRIQVTGSCGQVLSDAATIEVCAAPAITHHPQPQSVVDGDAATLSVTATGTAPFTYQWFQGTTALTGENASSLIVSPQVTTSYSVTVTNACGGATSNPATVTVTARCFRPLISAHPQSGSITSGQSFTLSVTAGGTSPKTYAWFANGTRIPDVDAATIDVSPAATTTYIVVITNDCGEASSNPATVTVTSCGDVPSITAHPQPATIESGQSTTLSVTANGTAPLSYQWFANGFAITGANAASQLVSPTATTSYHVVVSNSCGSATSSTATVTVGSCILGITGQPQSATIQTGGSTTLSVTATGNALSYQWYANGVAINGATAASQPVSPSATTSYHVVVSNACGSVTSNTATVTVSGCNLSITSQPQGTTIVAGDSATLSVGASGQQPLSYQWYANGVAIPNATASSVTVEPSSTTQFHVVVSNSCGSVNSATAKITVLPCQPSITSHPQSVSIAAGDNATLSVSATGNSLQYQWFDGTGAVVGNGSSSITVSPSATTDYYVVVSNSCGSRTSAIARVSVVACPEPSITTQPKDLTVEFRGNVTLSVVAAGQAPLAYRWYNGPSGDTSAPLFENGVPATRSSVSFQASTTTFYWVRITNACGVIDSVAAKVTMLACVRPVVDQQPQSVTITAGQSATLTVGASNPGPGTLTYQWYAMGLDFPSPVPNGTTASITVSPSATTTYYVHVYNGCGMDSSASVTVTVQPACPTPSITTQPQSVTINSGESAGLSVGASGSGLTYQWYVAASNQPVSNGTGSTVSVSPTQTTSYYVIVRNACGNEVRSSNVTVTVNACNPPVITSPTAQTNLLLRIGLNKTLTVVATGSNLSYQWYASEPEGSSFEIIPGATGASVVVSPQETSRFYVRVTNPCGNADSAQWRITVWDGIGDPPDPETQI